MATKTSIEWTDFSVNPIRFRDDDGKDVWACVKCSDGCKHCYAESLAHRFNRGKPFTAANMKALTPHFDEKVTEKILRSRRLAGKRVFVSDMTDVFGEWVPFDLLDRLFAAMALRPDVTFQILTKRPERMAEYLSDRELKAEPDYSAADYRSRPGHPQERIRDVALTMCSKSNPVPSLFQWPLPNVWLGTSIEDQKAADERIPHLLRCPAAVRFISAEPLLGEVDLTRLTIESYDVLTGFKSNCCNDVGWANTTRIDWLIVGGESGHGARPCNIEWIRFIIAQCRVADVPCFVKQLGSRYRHGDHKGADPDHWPDDLRVREMPCDVRECG